MHVSYLFQCKKISLLVLFGGRAEESPIRVNTNRKYETSSNSTQKLKLMSSSSLTLKANMALIEGSLSICSDIKTNSQLLADMQRFWTKQYGLIILIFYNDFLARTKIVSEFNNAFPTSI